MAQKLTDIPGKESLNGNLALVGTPEQPIVISGPVVVNNDLVILRHKRPAPSCE